MTKIKKIVAAAAAALTIGAIGTTAFASVNGFGFNFYMENRDDLYYDISDMVEKDNDTNYATVNITNIGTLSSNNKARLSIISDDIWPEDNVITGYKVVSGRTSFRLYYDDEEYRGDTYLFGTIWGSDTGSVKFGGDWTP